MEEATFIIAMIAMFSSFFLFIVELFKKGFKNISWTFPVILFVIYIMTYVLYLLISNA